MRFLRAYTMKLNPITIPDTFNLWFSVEVLYIIHFLLTLLSHCFNIRSSWSCLRLHKRTVLRSKAWASNTRNWLWLKASPVAVWTPPSSPPHPENHSRCSKKNRITAARARIRPPHPTIRNSTSRISPVHLPVIRQQCHPIYSIRIIDRMNRIWGVGQVAVVEDP